MFSSCRLHIARDFKKAPSERQLWHAKSTEIVSAVMLSSSGDSRQQLSARRMQSWDLSWWEQSQVQKQSGLQAVQGRAWWDL